MDYIFDHIGIAVFDINKAVEDYIQLGYSLSGGVKNIEVFQAKAAYMVKKESPIIELLEPEGENSPVEKILKQRGAGCYHTCYGVKDITLAIAEMRANLFIPLGKPVPGPGLDNALTVFMYKKSIGLIQLVERG